MHTQERGCASRRGEPRRASPAATPAPHLAKPLSPRACVCPPHPTARGTRPTCACASPHVYARLVGPAEHFEAGARDGTNGKNGHTSDGQPTRSARAHGLPARGIQAIE